MHISKLPGCSSLYPCSLLLEQFINAQLSMNKFVSLGTRPSDARKSVAGSLSRVPNRPAVFPKNQPAFQINEGLNVIVFLKITVQILMASIIRDLNDEIDLSITQASLRSVLDLVRPIDSPDKLKVHTSYFRLHSKSNPALLFIDMNPSEAVIYKSLIWAGKWSGVGLPWSVIICKEQFK